MKKEDIMNRFEGEWHDWVRNLRFSPKNIWVWSGVVGWAARIESSFW